MKNGLHYIQIRNKKVKEGERIEKIVFEKLKTPFLEPHKVGTSDEKRPL